MEKRSLLTFLLLLASFHASHAYFSELLINCGATSETPILPDGYLKWVTDEQYIETGQNSVVVINKNFSAMNTLRFFPIGNINCYMLPSHWKTKFLFRAGFYYGNYGGFNKPPSFDMVIDGNLWANVVTSGSQNDPIFYEIIYSGVNENTSICLVRTGEDVPIISSLQAVMVDYNCYNKMADNTALHLHSRINYGANKSIENLIDIYSEKFLRQWTSTEMPEYLNITRDYIPDHHLNGENKPPVPVMSTAIQAKTVTDSIYLTVDFSYQTEQVAYIVLYFMYPITNFENKTCKVDIYINNQKLNTTDVPFLFDYRVVTLYPLNLAGSVNITISPVVNSTLPPLINALEVFTVTDVNSDGKLVILYVDPAMIMKWLITLLCIFIGSTMVQIKVSIDVIDPASMTTSPAVNSTLAPSVIAMEGFTVTSVVPKCGRFFKEFYQLKIIALQKI
ncbi:hypothetical protein ACFE04_005698 [Oxalis oulophora]